MKHVIAATAALVLATSATAQDGPAPSPHEIVAGAPQSEWVAIQREDLLVMTLAPDRDGNVRRVVIQLMPAPFSQGWVKNIRTLARAQWYDGTSINRVQDNYVVQWGDVDGEDAAKAKPLPEGLQVMGEDEYARSDAVKFFDVVWGQLGWRSSSEIVQSIRTQLGPRADFDDAYSATVGFHSGFPFGQSSEIRHQSDAMYIRTADAWPVHCYGMVGVGRSYSPDTGSGAELYTVIGHAPRHLDRNTALVGRVIEGIEHLSSLPRGTGELGFYESADERVTIESIRMGTEAEVAPFEYLDTESATFARYAEARANRRDPFFIVPAGGADICNIPVPVRRVAAQ
ncbi:MAG: peptidylprolyl isomerase [Parerythrobacter sp.]